MEFNFHHFSTEFESYRQIKDEILYGTDDGNLTQKKIRRQVEIFNEFQTLDVKLRLAFGIREIKLNNDFVSDKEGDLKSCHLFFYKMSDLWFAYETYIKFVRKVSGINKDKILWLDQAVNANYSSSSEIKSSLEKVNKSLLDTFLNNRTLKKQLQIYLKYCLEQAESNGQKNRLKGIIHQIRYNKNTFSHTQVLAIIYAVRNNFVHNGETTILPDNFGFVNKARLLKILYEYLTIVLLKSINITCSSIPSL